MKQTLKWWSNSEIKLNESSLRQIDLLPAYWQLALGRQSLFLSLSLSLDLNWSVKKLLWRSRWDEKRLGRAQTKLARSHRHCGGGGGGDDLEAVRFPIRTRKATLCSPVWPRSTPAQPRPSARSSTSGMSAPANNDWRIYWSFRTIYNRLLSRRAEARRSGGNGEARRPHGPRVSSFLLLDLLLPIVLMRLVSRDKTRFASYVLIQTHEKHSSVVTWKIFSFASFVWWRQ